MTRYFRIAPIIAAGLMLAACGQQESESSSASAPTNAGACDRNCLIELTDNYLAALVANDPAAAPLADDIRFVENVARIAPGQGLWQTASAGPDDFAIYVPDTVMQQAGFLGVIEQRSEEGSQPILLAVRLMVVNGEITEAEHLLAEINPDNIARLQAPRSGLTTEVSAADRISRDELAAIGLAYYDALDDNDGSLMPFADDCQRHENGMVTAGPEAGPGPNSSPDRAPVARLCAAQLDSNSFEYIERIDNRRLIAADPVTGLAMGFSHFRHPFNNLPYDVIHSDGSISQRNAENMPYAPFDMPAAHIFKVGADGLVHEIEAVGVTAPYNSPSGWEEPDASCDRTCLQDMAETYIAALVAHDPAAAPLASDLLFVEDIIPMQPGEGAWESLASAPDSFQIFVPDEVNQTIGYIGMMTRMAAPPAPQDLSVEERAQWTATAERTEQPVMLAFRLQVENGEITEAEHLTTGIREPQMINLQVPRPGLLADVPAARRKSHSELIGIGYSYYDALDDNDGSLMSFAEDCERHENGMITAGGNAGAGPNGAGTGGVARDCTGQLTSNVMAYIDRIENRRVFAADPVTGLVMGLSHFRHPMDSGPYQVTNMDGSTEMREMAFDPFDLPAAHIFKIGADGRVHEIEAMGFMAPYNAPTGWE